MVFFKFGLMVAVAVAAFVVPAKADYFVWEDAKTGLTLSFPDTWKQMNNQNPTDLVNVSIPSGDDNASCRVRAEDDKRFLMYPNAARSDIRDDYFTKDFWDKYTSAYDNVTIVRQQDNAGLGKGFASMTIASYTTPPSTPEAGDMMDRAGLMAVAHYYDTVYVAECSTYMPNYAAYHTAFLQFFKSINFKKEHHELMVGDYENFLNQWGTIDVPFPNAVSRSTY